MNRQQAIPQARQISEELVTAIEIAKRNSLAYDDLAVQAGNLIGLIDGTKTLYGDAATYLERAQNVLDDFRQFCRDEGIL